MLFFNNNNCAIDTYVAEQFFKKRVTVSPQYPL